jgi:hypothetical protein
MAGCKHRGDTFAHGVSSGVRVTAAYRIREVVASWGEKNHENFSSLTGFLEPNTCRGQINQGAGHAVMAPCRVSLNVPPREALTGPHESLFISSVGTVTRCGP